MQSVLERLEKNIFIRPYASDGKDSQGIFVPCRKMSKEEALTKAVIQLNGPRRLAYIIIDIDYQYAALAWQDHNCPPPNLIITNPHNGHAHYVYELANPVWLGRRPTEDRNDPKLNKNDCPARGRLPEAKPVWLYKAITKALTSALHGDLGYNGLLAKNPFHPHWRVFYPRSEPYQLTELSAHLDLPVGGSSIPDPVIQESDNYSRVWDCILFNSVSKWARRAKSNYDNLEQFKSDIVDQLVKLNSTSDKPLKINELVGMGRRIAKWTWNVYSGGNGGGWKPSLGLSLDEIHQRQSLAGRQTCQSRRNETMNKIQVAIQTLQDRGSVVTKTAIASLTGLSRRTVFSYIGKGRDGAYLNLTYSENFSDSGNLTLSLTNNKIFSDSETLNKTVTLTTNDKVTLETEFPTGTSLQDASGEPDGTAFPTSYPELIEHFRDKSLPLVKMVVYSRRLARSRAVELANQGILVSGAPETLRTELLPLVDRGRNRGNYIEQRITQ